MANINFVPDDYIQKKDTCRANWMYMFLCLVVISAMAGTFAIIKIRQQAISRQAGIVAEKLLKAQEDISKFEELRAKQKTMMDTALTAVDLIEKVPRSIIIAQLTNSLPNGTSLSKVKLSEQVPNEMRSRRSNAAASDAKAVSQAYVEIEGYAPSDQEVADYIAALDGSELFNRVDLIYTQQYKKDREDTYSVRKFKLSTEINSQAQMTEEQIEAVKVAGR
jgi:Tfp pilus assembly protein PilN